MSHQFFKSFLFESSFQKCEIKYSNEHSKHNKSLNRTIPNVVFKQVITPNFLEVLEFSVRSSKYSNKITKVTLFDFELFDNGTGVIKFDSDIDEKYRETVCYFGYKSEGLFIRKKEMNYLLQGREVILLASDWTENIFKLRVKPGKGFFNILNKEKETSKFLYNLDTQYRKLLSLTSYDVILNDLFYYK